MRKSNNALCFYLERLFSAILRAYHVINLPGVRGWRGAGQMDGCIGRLVAAGVERATMGTVASPAPRLLVGGTASHLRACIPGRSRQEDRPAYGNVLGTTKRLPSCRLRHVRAGIGASDCG